MRHLFLVMCGLLGTAGCAPEVAGLEQSLGPRVDRPAGGAGGSVGAAGGVATNAPNPSWNARDRVPNLNPRVLTNNAYGPGRSSDQYGQVVYHNPGLRIEESALGRGDYTDQYGRSVRCYGSGMGTFCQ